MRGPEANPSIQQKLRIRSAVSKTAGTTIENEIVSAYQVREKRTLNVSPSTMEQLRIGMIEAVNGASGTAHQASLDSVEVAGKTGTAQWGPKSKERTAAWFSGFLPADQPRFAFAAVYEGDVGSKVHGGSTAAPMIAHVFKDVYKQSAQQMANNNQRRRREPVRQEIRRAQTVEEDGLPSGCWRQGVVATARGRSILTTSDRGSYRDMPIRRLP